MTERTMAGLLHCQRLEEDRRAAQGYFVCALTWRPLPPLERLRARLGPWAEPGGTIESRYLYRPEVALREPPASGAARHGPPPPIVAADGQASAPTRPRWRVLPHSAAH
ncbi:MAG TPA: hypothetical protein VFW92_01975 [Candidatus Limnocylindrales bacterium]|nr:hypothetical protein [Candidatus Limnocylindrales bacterium]